MNRTLKIILIVAMVLAATGGVGGLTWGRLAQQGGGPREEKEAANEVTVPVAVSRAGLGAIREGLAVTAGVRAASEVAVQASVPGKVKSIAVQEGQRVARGQVLALVERDQAGLKFADAPVEAPISGTVAQVLVDAGGPVTPAVALFRIVDLDAVEVALPVPEADSSRVAPGLAVEVHLKAWPGRGFRGTVSRLSPVLDSFSRTREAYVRVANPDHALRPGMSGSAEIVLRSTDSAVVIPAAALVDRGGKEVAYLVRDGRAVEVAPEIGIRRPDRVSVTSGIAAGEAVVVIGQHNLRDGDAVLVVEENR